MGLTKGKSTPKYLKINDLNALFDLNKFLVVLLLNILINIGLR